MVEDVSLAHRSRGRALQGGGRLLVSARGVDEGAAWPERATEQAARNDGTED